MAHRRVGWGSVLAVGTAGTVAAHALGYWAAYSTRDARDAALSATGHSYWHTAVVVALVLGLAGPLLQALMGATRRDHGADVRRSLSFLWLRLCALQLTAFLALEMTERAGHAVSLAAWHEPVFWITIPFQVGVAAAGAALLRLGARIGRSLSAVAIPVIADFAQALDEAPPPPVLGFDSHRSLRTRAPPFRLHRRSLSMWPMVRG
jgi:hypothetical protein